ncbi:hypothetical protein [Mucilaginibacter sp.]|uniref:hypothetical protein n=1 Tax=Mucilaginibacter sp. TaxID=1882438 RepID=UPI00261594D9|nr:hypothetical protein [Mucilaginibacter sp.]MDB5030061.1 hypothetical protein [Mucilaginibacter sp.]
MKKAIIGYCFLFSVFLSYTSFGQKLKSEAISYNYNRLPALPVKGIDSYQLTFEAAYEARNQQLVNEYEQQRNAAEEKYRNDVASYTAQVKAANDRYDKAIAEYNKKSLGTKIAEMSLLDNKKPVREIISKPYLATVEKPNLQSSYDYGVIANTYIKLEGYKNEPGNGLRIKVVLYGFDHTRPRSMDEQQENVKLGGSGSSGMYKSTLYHTEFSYRHPMAVKVYAPDGKEMLSLTPPELNSYKIYKGPATDRPSGINYDLLLKTTEEKILQDNLRFINNLLNDKYGYSSIKRVATLYYIKNGDNGYTDLTTAFNEASSGLLMMQQDANSGKAKLQKACDLWNTALKEADISNKKARINKDIALGIYFDLLEAYFALSDTQGGESTLEKLNTLSMDNSDRRIKLDFDVLFAELKNRQLHN